MAVNILLQDDQAKRAYAGPVGVSERWVALALVASDSVLLVLVTLATLASGANAVDTLFLFFCFLLLIASKAVFGLYPGHGLDRALRMRNVIMATAAWLLLDAAYHVLSTRVLLIPIDLPLWPLLAAALLLGINDPLMRWLLHRLGRWQQPVFIFGGGEVAAGLVRQLDFYPYLGFRAVCIVDETALYIADDHHGIPVIRFRELGEHSRLLSFASTALVVEQIVERSFILRLYTTGIFRRILLVPSCHDLISLNSQMRRVGSMLAIEAGGERPSQVVAWCKRAFDIVASGIALVLLSPLLALLAFLVGRDSPGPALFSQPRWAGGDRQFTALKFRTMYIDGDRRLRLHFLNYPQAEREYARFRKLDKDPRVTPMGRFLRATSLDELPQLVNVLRGEMSIVGPRPYTMDELGKLGPASEILGLVRPGITGFWQVSGRNQRTFRERIEMDCYYVRNHSPWLDIWIVYRTVIAVILREGK